MTPPCLLICRAGWAPAHRRDLLFTVQVVHLQTLQPLFSPIYPVSLVGDVEVRRCEGFFGLLQQVGSTQREGGSCQPRLCFSRAGKYIPQDGQDHPNPTALSSLKPPCPQGEQTRAARPAMHTPEGAEQAAQGCQQAWPHHSPESRLLPAQACPQCGSSPSFLPLSPHKGFFQRVVKKKKKKPRIQLSELGFSFWPRQRQLFLLPLRGELAASLGKRH